jgi:hypothetical protein
MDAMQGWKFWLVVAGLALVALAAFMPWPRPNRVTPENLPNGITPETFDRIKDGMTRSEVEAILGPPGDYTTGDPIHAISMIGIGDDDLCWDTDVALVLVGFDKAGRVYRRQYHPVLSVRPLEPGEPRVKAFTPIE